ncbi:MAG: tetratricopeptide repeat protein [Cyclobacteriaceae bacterium]
MKKLALLLTLNFIALFVFAQNKNVNKADRALQDGEYQEALQLIEEAAQHEKTMDKGKTWFTRGQIYQAIAFAEDESVQNMAENPFQEAVESYQKVQELEGENNMHSVFAGQSLTEISNLMLNKGAEAYQEGDFEDAIEAFEKTKLVNPDDTTGYMYAGVAAMQGGLYEKAAENYYTLLNELDYKELDIYTSLLWIERNHNKDEDKALELVREAREQYPDNLDLMKEEINLLITMENTDEAREKLEQAIQSDPENPSLYYSLAYLYDEVGESEKAIDTYKKAIEFDPEYFEANFNLAVIYFNKGVEILKEANNMDLETYQKKAKEVIAEADKYFEKALPYLEKSHEIQPEDMTVMETLETAYSELQMEEEAETMAKKIEESGGLPTD